MKMINGTQVKGLHRDIRRAAKEAGSVSELNRLMGGPKNYLHSFLHKPSTTMQAKTFNRVRTMLDKATGAEPAARAEPVKKKRGKKKASLSVGGKKVRRKKKVVNVNDALEAMGIDFSEAPPVEISVGATKITLELVAPGAAPVVIRVGNLRATMESFATK